jgi:hypothetical protein
MNVDDVMTILDMRCKAHGSRIKWAKAHGVSPSYVNTCFQGKREPGKLILDALGITKIVDYQWGRPSS